MIVDTGAYVLSLIMVLIGCLFRDFVIPLFVWRKHFIDKSYSYRFWFCVITQAVIQINLVMLLGLLGILNRITFISFNILIYLLIIWNYSDKLFINKFKASIKEIWNAYKEDRLMKHILEVVAASFKRFFRALIKWPIWRYIKKNWLELFLLAGVIIYNIWFLTHNVMLYHSYQFSDVPVHQSWIYELEQGNLFSDGIYPFGMHIMIYFVRVIFSINLREILLYAGAYQFVIVIIGVYLLSKKIFSGRYTPIAVILITSLMLNQGRYAASLPQEAGMFAVIAVAYFMIHYLHTDKKKYVIESDNRIRRIIRINSYINRSYICSELILLMLSVSLVISYHYYTAIAASFIVIAVGISYIPKILKKQYFVPLMFCGIMGAIIAIVPIGAALVRGIPFQESIEWATTILSGDEWHGSDADYQDELAKALGNNTSEENVADIDSEQDAENKIDYSNMTSQEILEHYYNSIYNLGTSSMFGAGQTKLLFVCMIIGFIFSLIMFIFRKTRNIGHAYMSVILIMMIFFTLGASQSLGIPEIIAAARASTFAQPFMGIIYVMPIDFLFRILSGWKKKYISILVGAMSLAFCGASVFFIIDAGWYHKFFDVNQAYYNEPIYLLRNIKKSFDKYSYTIVATTDEYYDVIDHGRHTEMSRFINAISKSEENFNFTTNYVFFFIEKKLLQDYNYGRVDVSLEYAVKDFVFMGDVQDYYFQRAVIQSKAFYWAKAFQKTYPRNFKVYFEDDIYIVYLMEQNTYFPYDLQINFLEEYKDAIKNNNLNIG